MQSEVDRASQFLPFDALKGFKEAILLKEKKEENKKILFDDFNDILNLKLKKIKKGDIIKIKFFYNLEYIETVSEVKEINYSFKYLLLSNSKIYFDDILDITIDVPLAC